VLKKLAIIFFIAGVIIAGSGWYLWEKNAKVITQLQEFEKSLLELEETQEAPKVPAEKPNKKPVKPEEEPNKTDNQNRKEEKQDRGNQVSDKPSELSKKVDLSDRAEAIAIVSSKLTSGDMNRLRQLAQGGFTPEEKKEAKAIVKARLSSEEIKRLKALYYKYSN